MATIAFFALPLLGGLIAWNAMLGNKGLCAIETGMFVLFALLLARDWLSEAANGICNTILKVGAKRDH